MDQLNHFKRPPPRVPHRTCNSLSYARAAPGWYASGGTYLQCRRTATSRQANLHDNTRRVQLWTGVGTAYGHRLRTCWENAPAYLPYHRATITSLDAGQGHCDWADTHPWPPSWMRS